MSWLMRENITSLIKILANERRHYIPLLADENTSQVAKPMKKVSYKYQCFSQVYGTIC